MQRISLSILDRMIKERLTRCEIGFLLCASRYQDTAGHIQGLYYKKICKDMGCSYPMFYAAMRTLEKKGFLACEKKDASDYDITILGNDYQKNDIYKDSEEKFRAMPYINTRHDIFYSQEFYRMKPGAQLMALSFMDLSRKNGGIYSAGVEFFYEKYRKLLGVTNRTIRGYITQLKQFFSIGIKNSKYWVRPKACVYRKDGNTETDNYNEHYIETVCRREKIRTGEGKELTEVRELIRQYGRKCKEAGRDALETVVEAIRRSVDSVWGMAADERALAPKLVHKWVKRLLEAGWDKTPESKPAGKGPADASPKNKFNNFPQREYDMEALNKVMFNL